MMENIELILTVEEVNIVLNTLADRPYREVCEVVSKIMQQAREKTAWQTKCGIISPFILKRKSRGNKND